MLAPPRCWSQTCCGCTGALKPLCAAVQGWGQVVQVSGSLLRQPWPRACRSEAHPGKLETRSARAASMWQLHPGLLQRQCQPQVCLHTQGQHLLCVIVHILCVWYFPFCAPICQVLLQSTIAREGVHGNSLKNVFPEQWNTQRNYI